MRIDPTKSTFRMAPGRVLVKLNAASGIGGGVAKASASGYAPDGEVVRVGKPDMMMRRFFWEFWKPVMNIKVGHNVIVPKVSGQSFRSHGVDYVIHHAFNISAYDIKGDVGKF